MKNGLPCLLLTAALLTLAVGRTESGDVCGVGTCFHIDPYKPRGMDLPRPTPTPRTPKPSSNDDHDDDRGSGCDSPNVASQGPTPEEVRLQELRDKISVALDEELKAEKDANGRLAKGDLCPKCFANIAAYLYRAADLAKSIPDYAEKIPKDFSPETKRDKDAIRLDVYKTDAQRATHVASRVYLVAKAQRLRSHLEKVSRSLDTTFVPTPEIPIDVPAGAKTIWDWDRLNIIDEERLLNELGWGTRTYEVIRRQQGQLNSLAAYFSWKEALWRVVSDGGHLLEPERREGWKRFVAIEKEFMGRAIVTSDYLSRMVAALGSGTFNQRELAELERRNTENWCEFADIVANRSWLVERTPEPLQQYVPSSCH